MEDFNAKKDQVVNDITEIFANMSIEEIDILNKAIRTEATAAKKAIRAEIKAVEKAEKLAEREKVSSENKENLDKIEEGTSLTILTGSGKNVEEVTGTFVKMTEKRFTVLVDGSKKSVMFHRLVSINEAITEVSENDTFIDDSEDDLEIAL